MPGTVDTKNHQGGKAYGQAMDKLSKEFEEVNQTYLDNDDYADEDEFPELKQQLEAYKKQFIEYDKDMSGDINIMELKMMMESLDQTKTHLELKKMIAEVDRENRGAISYNDFLYMMLGKSTSVLKKVLKFTEKMKPKEYPKGIPPKRDLSSLP